MKIFRKKQIWVDDDNHHLKGYFQDELVLVKVNFFQAIIEKCINFIVKAVGYVTSKRL